MMHTTLRNKMSEGAEKVLTTVIKAVEPFAEAQRQIESATWPDDSIDSQHLSEKAAMIAESDPARALFAGLVMIELDAQRISLQQADFYLTPPNERV